ncbi:MAG: helix-turn-helix transcriptional regulator [Candidatus Bipolaricaulota bacterium]
MGVPDLGTLVRTARAAKGMTLRELARGVGMDASRLWRIERGDRPPPPLPQLRALAELLNVSLADLLVAGGTSKEVLESLLWSGRLSFGGQEAFSPLHPDLWRRNTFLAPVVERCEARVTVELGQERLTALSFAATDRLWVVIPPEAVLVVFGAAPPFLEANVLGARPVKVRRIGQLTNVVLACRGFEVNALTVCEDAASEESDLQVVVPPAAIRTLPFKEW